MALRGRLARLAAVAFKRAVSAIEVELCLGSVASTIRLSCLMAPDRHPRRRRRLYHHTSEGRPAARRVANRDRMSDAGRETGRANDVCAHRYHEGVEPPCRTRVRPVAEGQALGTPEDGARSITNACNYRGFDPDRLRTPATSCGMLRVAVRVKRARVAGCPRRLARCVAIVVRRTASRGGTLRCAEAHAFPTMVSISPTRLIDYANMAGRDATSRQLCCHSRHLFRSRRKGRDCCNGM
jgi:hypothetical protein